MWTTCLKTLLHYSSRQDVQEINSSFQKRKKKTLNGEVEGM
jgi:hypothetical protein